MKLPAAEVHRRQRTKSGILTPEEVGVIKWWLEQGKSPREMARAYQMSLWTMRAIARGDTWDWVPATPPGQLVQTNTADRAAEESYARLQEMLAKQAEDDKVGKMIEEALK
jgi:hypothetical protein